MNARFSLPALPWYFRGVVAEAAPGVVEIELFHHRPPAGDALRGTDPRAGTAHAGLHPAGVQQQHADAAAPEFHRQALHGGVERGLAGTIVIAARLADLGDAAHVAADGDDQAALAARDVVDEGLGHPHRAERIDLESVQPIVVGQAGAERVVELFQRDAGFVDEHVDGLFAERGGERRDFVLMGGIEPMDADVGITFGEAAQLAGFGGMTATGMNPPAVLRVLMPPFEAEAAVTSGDEDGGHAISCAGGRPLLGGIGPVRISTWWAANSCLGACHWLISAEPPRGDYFAPGFIVDCARHVDSRRRRSALWRTRVMVARAGPPATICCEPRQARKGAAAAAESGAGSGRVRAAASRVTRSK